jgi:GNAT superfamily N-acetyltransferase
MIEIRACAPADAASVGALLRQLGYEASDEAVGQRVQQLNATGSDPIFVACKAGQPRGLIGLHLCHMIQYQNPVARVTALVVDDRSRRRGVGRRLIDHALHWAERAGCEFVELTSAIDRTEAHAFYRSLGFDANSLRFRKSLGR